MWPALPTMKDYIGDSIARESYDQLRATSDPVVCCFQLATRISKLEARSILPYRHFFSLGHRPGHVPCLNPWQMKTVRFFSNA